MTRWGKTCDQVDDLDGFAPLPVVAARYITFALDGPGSFNKVGAAIRAGAYLRAYRRTLPFEDARVPDDEVDDDQPDEELLWFALKLIAELPERLAVEHGEWVRWAEACLRVWWKRQQEVAP